MHVRLTTSFQKVALFPLLVELALPPHLLPDSIFWGFCSRAQIRTTSLILIHKGTNKQFILRENLHMDPFLKICVVGLQTSKICVPSICEIQRNFLWIVEDEKPVESWPDPQHKKWIWNQRQEKERESKKACPSLQKVTLYYSALISINHQGNTPQINALTCLFFTMKGNFIASSFIPECGGKTQKPATEICMVLNYTLVNITWQSVHINLIGF